MPDRYIKPDGSVVVSNASFERAINMEVGRLGRNRVSGIEQINGSLHDLRDIFREQLLFSGSSPLFARDHNQPRKLLAFGLAVRNRTEITSFYQ